MPPLSMLLLLRYDICRRYADAITLRHERSLCRLLLTRRFLLSLTPAADYAAHVYIFAMFCRRHLMLTLLMPMPYALLLLMFAITY